MAVKSFKPVTPGRRQMTVSSFEGLAKKRPERGLTEYRKNNAGRNNTGRITTRHRGGGNKKLYRVIDFDRTGKLNIPAKVMALEYDPNRTCRIALLFYKDGEKRYVIAPEGLKVGETIICAPKAKIVTGNRMMIKNVPVGFNIYEIEMRVGRGGQVCRSAGSSAKVVSLEGEYAQIEMPSKEIRLVPKESYVSIGIVSNLDHQNVKLGKAGRTRWLRRRPEVRGKVMNPVDHPHGGGEGRNSIGLKYPKTPWGKHALGKKTRNPRKSSSRLILKRRK